MIDNIHTVKPHADILVPGDFDIDLLKPHSSWDSTITLLGLTQLVKSPARITQTSANIYILADVCVILAGDFTSDFTSVITSRLAKRNHRGQCT